MIYCNAYKNSNIFLIGVLLIIYLLSVILLIINSNNPDFIYFTKQNFINIASLIIFSITLYLCNISLKYFSLCLIFILLSFPSSINNFSPSILISSIIDVKQIHYPIITHIDFFLLFGIFRYKERQVTTTYIIWNIKTMLFFLLLLLLSISLFVNIFLSDQLSDLTIIVSTSYHLRYLILLYLLFFNTKIINYGEQIFQGLFLSVAFLVLESILYSYFFFNPLRLTSGSLRVNSFANILSAISCYYTFLLIRKKISSKYFFLVPIILIVVLLTETRSAFFLFCIYLLIEVLKYLIRNFNLKTTLFVLISTILLFFSLSYLSFSDRASLKYLKIEKIDFTQKELSKIVVLKENDFSKSLILRLNHFQTSLYMIRENPFFGIGPGLWNKYKSNYGSVENKIMDSHNDILAMASQYGLIQGLIICLSIYFGPLLFLIKKRRILIKDKWDYLFIISLSMTLLGLTNAGIFKHQIFGFLSLIFIISFFKGHIKQNDLETNIIILKKR